MSLPWSFSKNRNSTFIYQNNSFQKFSIRFSSKYLTCLNCPLVIHENTKENSTDIWAANSLKKKITVAYNLNIWNIEERKEFISDIQSLHLYLPRGNGEEDEYMCKVHNRRILGRTTDAKTSLLKYSWGCPSEVEEVTSRKLAWPIQVYGEENTLTKNPFYSHQWHYPGNFAQILHSSWFSASFAKEGI